MINISHLAVDSTESL